MCNKQNRVARNFVCLLLIACMLFPILSSCSRRGTYEEILESKKEAESLAAIPETNGNITGENAPDYQTPIILKTGDTPFYEGKTLEDLQAISRASGHKGSSINMIPTGRLYKNTNATKTYFYNKLTGNFSNWCSDPLCDGNGCIWSSMYLEIQYISDDSIYFLSSLDELSDQYGVYRCDFQRNHIEKVLDIACVREPGPDVDGDGEPDGSYMVMDEVTVVYEKDNILYYKHITYNPNNEDTFGSLYELNLNTKEKQLLSGNLDLASVTIINDVVYYKTSNQPAVLYRTDLAFSSVDVFQKNLNILAYNDKYLLLKEIDGPKNYIYNMQNGQMIPLEINGGISKGNIVLSGDYVYYSRKLTDTEIANDPLKDYYTYTWEEASYRPHGNGKPIQKETDTQDAGKIYRIYIGSENAKEECVFQFTYKGVPVRIKDIDIDGDVLYISYHNYEGFTNFYNQDFSGNEYAAVCYAVADLQNGSVTILDLPNEE